MKWSKSQEVKGLAWPMETLFAILLDARPGVGLPKAGIHTYLRVMSTAAYLNNNVRIPAISTIARAGAVRAALNRRGVFEIYCGQDRSGRARGGPAAVTKPEKGEGHARRKGRKN